MLLVHTYPEEDIPLRYISIGAIVIDDDIENIHLNQIEVKKYNIDDYIQHKVSCTMYRMIRELINNNINKQGKDIRRDDALNVVKNFILTEYREHTHFRCTKRLRNIKYYRLTVSLSILEHYSKCSKKIVPKIR